MFNNAAVEPSVTGDATGPGGEAVEEIHAARDHTRLRWRPISTGATPIRFDLYQSDRLVRLDLWSGDTGRVPREEMRSLLLAVEGILVAAAHGDVDSGRVHTAAGLAPIARGPDWLLVDSCWVDLAETQRLLDVALAPTTVRVFPLWTVSHLSLMWWRMSSCPTLRGRMAALPGRPAATAPRRYIMCAAAPDDPARLASWQAMTVG